MIGVTALQCTVLYRIRVQNDSRISIRNRGENKKKVKLITLSDETLERFVKMHIKYDTVQMQLLLNLGRMEEKVHRIGGIWKRIL